MRVLASAPTKAILCGEHYVVYGAPSICFPIGEKNFVEVEDGDGEPGMEVLSPWGDYYLDANASKQETVGARAFAEMLKQIDVLPLDRKFKVSITLGKSFKGMGNSASTFAAFGLALGRFFGKDFSNSELFELVQAAECVAHGGRASGIDAHTIINGRPVKFEKNFKPVSYVFEDMAFGLPKETTLLLVNTRREVVSTTAEMVSAFAASHGLRKKPEETTLEERRQICEAYAPVFEQVMEALRHSNAENLGKSMNENHALLRRHGVSSPEIEEVIAIALRKGALGAKITGAGGRGGAVLVFARENEAKEIQEEISRNGFGVLCEKTALEGAKIEKIVEK